MTDLNSIFIIGRITKDLDEYSFGYLSTGQARANVSIAVNRSRKNGEQWIDEVSFFDVTIWGKTAENLKPYLQKGKQIAVDGYLKQDRWEKEGQKFSKISIVANNVQLLGGKSDGVQNQLTNGVAQPAQYVTSKATQGMTNYEDSFDNSGSDFQEDIPF